MKSLLVIIFLSVNCAQANDFTVICEDPRGRQSSRIEFSPSSLECRINGGNAMQSRESQATSAYYCGPSQSTLNENYKAIINLDRDRNPVSARILNDNFSIKLPRAGPGAVPCHFRQRKNAFQKG